MPGRPISTRGPVPEPGDGLGTDDIAGRSISPPPTLAAGNSARIPIGRIPGAVTRAGIFGVFSGLPNLGTRLTFLTFGGSPNPPSAFRSSAGFFGTLIVAFARNVGLGKFASG